MKIFFITLLLTFILLVFLFPTLTAQAQEETWHGFIPCGRVTDDEGTTWDETEPCDECDFLWMVSRLWQFLVWRATPVLGALFVVIGGFMFLTAGGSPERVARAKKILTAVVIGAVIIYLSWILINLIFSFVDEAAIQRYIPGFKRESWSIFHCEPPPEQ